MAAPAKPRRRDLGFMVRALRHRNFALFFSGQMVSLVGTWLSMVATSWLVYRLTRESQPEHAALMLGVVNFAAQIPIFVLAPVAGVWLDRLESASRAGGHAEPVDAAIVCDGRTSCCRAGLRSARSLL